MLKPQSPPPPLDPPLELSTKVLFNRLILNSSDGSTWQQQHFNWLVDIDVQNLTSRDGYQCPFIYYIVLQEFNFARL